MTRRFGFVEEESTSITAYIVAVAFSITFFLFLIHWRHRNSKIYKYGNKLPGPRAWPFFGNVLIAIGKKQEEFVKLALQYRSLYGHVARGWIGHKLIIFIANAEDAEVILNSHVHIKKAAEYQLFKPWLGDGLLISSGAKWKSHRKMIAPTFHINILKSFIGIFNENSKHVIEKMRAESGKTFDVHEYMSEATVDILLETAMGTTKSSHGGSGFDYAMAVMKMCDILHQRHYKFWLRPEFIFQLTSLSSLQKKLLDIIHGLTDKVIKIKKEAYIESKKQNVIGHNLEEVMKPSKSTQNVTQNGNALSDDMFKGYKDDLDYIDENDVDEKRRLAFLDLMIESVENGVNNMSYTELKEEVNTIMFEGHDTTAAGSSFVLCLLGVHQDAQAKVYEEMQDIFEDSDRPITFLDTLRMKYLERVILESLRLYSPVPIIARELTEDVKIATNNYILPAGATVVITPLGIHRNPKYYKDPDVFNPDNFLPEKVSARHYYSFVPFSAGPRSCVGRKYAFLKLKVLLSSILREFKVESDIPEEDFVLSGDIILKRADGFKVRLTPRN